MELALGAIAAYYLFYNKLVLSNNLKIFFTNWSFINLFQFFYLIDRHCIHLIYFDTNYRNYFIRIFADEQTLVKKFLSIKALVGLA